MGPLPPPTRSAGAMPFTSSSWRQPASAWTQSVRLQAWVGAATAAAAAAAWTAVAAAAGAPALAACCLWTWRAWSALQTRRATTASGSCRAPRSTAACRRSRWGGRGRVGEARAREQRQGQGVCCLCVQRSAHSRGTACRAAVGRDGPARKTPQECFRLRNAAARAGADGAARVVPYREATLSRLMKRVLEPSGRGGAAPRVVVVATISPAAAGRQRGKAVPGRCPPVQSK